MQPEFEERQPDWRDSVQRFEVMLKNHERQFFDLDAYEHIVEHYIGEGNWERALQACEFGLEHFPYSLELMLDKAHLLAQNQRFDESINLLERAALFNPHDLDVLFMQGGVYNMMGEYEQSVEVYEKMLNFVEEDEKDDILFQIGQAYQNGGKYEDAIKYYKKSLANNLENENALYELAFCLEITGQMENSIDYYNELIDRDPYSSNAWYNLGIVYSKLGRYEEALHAYDYATVIKEDFASAYFNMANAYMNLERYTEANSAYLLTLQHESPSADLFCHLGASFEKLKDFGKALENYREALKLDKEWDEAWYGVAVCLAVEEKWLESLNCIQKAIKLNEHIADYLLMLADLEYKIGNFIASNEAFEKAAELEPDFEDVWLKWSLVLFDQGQFDRAYEIIQQGIDDIPENASLYYRAAAYLLHAGDYREAILNLEVALALDYDAHEQLYDFFPELEKQKALFKLIEQYKK
jgi:tetratricopeptide (TPR) repeat protein